MYPQCPLPRHITALYVVAVASCVALFSHGVALVGADVLVYSLDYHEEPETEFRDMPSRFGVSLPIDGLKGPWYEFLDMPAEFGPPIPPEGVEGFLVLAYPDEQACKQIEGPPVPYGGNFVVLIRRYGCTFEEKVRRAQEANYSAAIVYNVNSSELEPMSAKNATGIIIPSVFVGDEAGSIMKGKYIYPEQYYVLINDEMPFNINTHLLLPFAIVVGICFLIMVVFMVVKCIKDRRRQRRHRLPSSSLKKIPTAKFAKGDPYETCAICLEDYQEGEKLRILPCSHAYHSKCIDPWLTRNRRVCPVCKRKVFAQGEQVVETESESDTDDTTPLVRPSSYGTQGGTFVPQRENPFQRASRQQRRPRSTSSSSASSAGAISSASSSTTTSSGSHGGTAAATTTSTSASTSVKMPEGELAFNVTSSGEHSINTDVEIEEAAHSEEVVTAQEATAMVVDPATAARNSSAQNEKKPDLVV